MALIGVSSPIISSHRLMPLETPLLRVSRPVAACQRCRSAKIKCDGKLPACTACEKSGRADQCSSTNSQFAPGKERSYVATLEAKVERLQKRLEEANKRKQSTVSMIDTASPTTPYSKSTSTFSSPNPNTPGSPAIPKDRKSKVNKELASIDDLVSDFGFLTVNATARDLTYNFTHSISYAKLILAASSKEQLSASIRKDLTNQTYTEDTGLIKFYVDNVNPLLPIFDNTDIWRSWHSISTNPESSTYMEFWTCRMILAISTIMHCEQRGDSTYINALGHITAALEVADHVLHPGSIYSIQAMLLLVQYSMLDPSHFDSWTLIGAACRAMIDLGLHQDPSKSANTKRAKLELRRRLYHCCYALDRSTSIVQTRTYSFSDDSATVGDPLQINQQSSNKGNVWTHSHNAFMKLIRIRKIQSEWYSHLYLTGKFPLENAYGYIWPKYHEMTKWFESLNEDIPTSIKRFFHLDLLYSYVYILAASPACPHPSEHAQRLIISHCTTYASILKNQAHHPNSTGTKQPTPFSFYDGLRVYMMGRCFLDTLNSNLDILLTQSTHSPSRYTAFPNLDVEVDPLTTMPSLPPPQIPLQDPSISPISQAIETINAFLAILTSFSLRFGVTGISWHHKFSSEASPLLSQLHSKLHAPSPVDSFLWQTTSNGQQPALMGTSPIGHGMSTAGVIYPSPPSSSHISPHQYPVAPVSNIPTTDNTSTSPESTWISGNEFGIDNLAAWKTLPGGIMNSRFS